MSQEVTELHGGGDGSGLTETETPYNYNINYSVLGHHQSWSFLNGEGGYGPKDAGSRTSRFRSRFRLGDGSHPGFCISFVG